MPLTALMAVLLAAATHATWNLAAKRASASRHFVFLYSALSVAIYAPVVLWIVIRERPQFELVHWLALATTAALHLGYSLMLQAGYRASDLSLVYPLAMQVAPISHVAPARELATLIGTYFGARLLNERAAPVRLAGAACMVIGVISLALAQPTP